MSRTRTPETPLLNVRVCSHGKTNDGGFSTAQEGVKFAFPACGRWHVADRAVYEIDPQWLEDQRIADERRARLALAREARRG